MKLEKILKFTRNYRGLFDERISTWLFRKYIKGSEQKGITWFNSEKIAIYFSSTEYIERRVWMLGEYEPEVASVFSAYVAKGGTALDIGANIGINSIRLANLVGPSGKVFSFEPIPFNQNRFKKNIELNLIDNITLVPMALGVSTETLKLDFNEHEENMGAISLRNAGDVGIDIQVRKGDDWVKENNIQQINFIKIDVEGFEWNVIDGLNETIKNFHPSILIEWDLNYLEYSGISKKNWQGFIDENSYKIYQINRYELKEVSAISNASDGNLLFI